MGQQDAAGLGRPLKDGLIIRPRQPCVLHADDIYRRAAAADAAHDIVVEVLVGREPEHERSRLTPPSQ